MFTERLLTSANSNELQEKLTEIGYNNTTNARDRNDKFLFGQRGVFCTLHRNYATLYNFLHIYDCGDNEDLFLALARLRDDSYANQWFTDDGTRWELSNSNGEVSLYMILEGHRATREEIIEHFKK